jgi:hypothetical protein
MKQMVVLKDPMMKVEEATGVKEEKEPMRREKEKISKNKTPLSCGVF